MMTSTEMDTLRKLAEWIIPPDEAETSGGNAAIPYLLSEIKTGSAAAFLPELRRLLGEMEDSSSLTDHETDPAFLKLAELIQEGFYTSPEGLAMVGFKPVRMEAL